MKKKIVFCCLKAVWWVWTFRSVFLASKVQSYFQLFMFAISSDTLPLTGSRLTKFRKKHERIKIYFDNREYFLRSQILSNGWWTQSEGVKIWLSDSPMGRNTEKGREHAVRSNFSKTDCVPSVLGLPKVGNLKYECSNLR